MEFNEIIKREAINYAKKHSIVEHGDIVMTQWADWKKPHKVMIYDIGACLSCDWDKVKRETYATLGMYYYARRLNADGRVFKNDKAGGIVLEHFFTNDGTEWKKSKEDLNHCAYSWSLPVPRGSKIN